jgi:hypothetical protein
MGVAMRIHRDSVEIDGFMAKGPLNGGPGLPAVQNDGLVMQDRPLVEHVGVGSDRRRAAARIMARSFPRGRIRTGWAPKSRGSRRPESQFALIGPM